MKIGLVRHLEVNSPPKKTFMTSEEFSKWAKEYEARGIKSNAIAKTLNEWPCCICSSSIRTVQTANLIYNGPIKKSDLITEVPIGPVFITNRKLPFIFWLVSGRVAWLLSHKSQQESLKDTITRVKKFISSLISSGNNDILIVSHGFIMRLIKRELYAKGFTGEKFSSPKHGRLYIFEK